MSENVEQLLLRLSKDPLFKDAVEQAIRLGAVLPILAELGWKVFDIHEVVPEFPAEKGRVDYCLKIGEKKCVFLEVKRGSEDLEGHEDQLLVYSYHDGVELGVLTNGLVWWLYLPMASGSKTKRKFLSIDIERQRPVQAAEHFVSFLSRDAIADGSALKRAKSMQASAAKADLISKTTPKAWEQILEEPDTRLLDLLADRVEGMCGHRPTTKQLTSYLRGWQPGRVPGKPVPPERQPKGQLQGRKSGGAPGAQKRITINIDGNSFGAVSVRNLYEQVLEFLVTSGHIDKLRPHLPFATSKVRYLLATEPYHQRGNKFMNPAEHEGYFMEAHKAYPNAVSALRKLLRVCGLSLEVIA